MSRRRNNKPVAGEQRPVKNEKAMITFKRLLIAFVLLPVTGVAQGVSSSEFEYAENFEETQRRHRLVPSDDMWWTVTGEQMAWMHRNAHQLFPTVNVYRNGPVRELHYAVDPAIAAHTVETPDGEMRFDDFLSSNHSTALGVVILHKGRIVFERYPRMKAYEKPVYWSTSKIFPAIIIRLFEERGLIDVEKPVQFYLPELTGSVFNDITVRNILDMASGIDCGDEYEDRESCYYQYSMAIGDGYRDDDAPDNPYDFLKNVKAAKLAEQGTEFSYSGVNTFILGWIIEKITGQAFHDVFTKEIWYQIGAEADASFIAYRYGIPLTHGGFFSTMRDLARLGLLFTPSYAVVSDRQIITDEHIDFLQSAGNPALHFDDGGQSIFQWIVYPNGNLTKAGWGGQGIIIDPEHDVVAVFASYFKDDYSEVPLEGVVVGVLEDVYGDMP